MVNGETPSPPQYGETPSTPNTGRPRQPPIRGDPVNPLPDNEALVTKLSSSLMLNQNKPHT